MMMERRKFISTSLVGASAITTGFASNLSVNPALNKQLFEFREYQLRFGTDAAALDNYLKNALIPALNKLGVQQIGVFKETSRTEPARIYAIIPYSSWNECWSIQEKLNLDQDFLKKSSDYNSILPDFHRNCICQ